MISLNSEHTSITTKDMRQIYKHTNMQTIILKNAVFKHCLIQACPPFAGIALLFRHSLIQACPPFAGIALFRHSLMHGFFVSSNRHCIQVFMTHSAAKEDLNVLLSVQSCSAAINEVLRHDPRIFMKSLMQALYYARIPALWSIWHAAFARLNSACRFSAIVWQATLSCKKVRDLLRPQCFLFPDLLRPRIPLFPK